jgi:hypothetical protein
VRPPSPVAEGMPELGTVRQATVLCAAAQPRYHGTADRS